MLQNIRVVLVETSHPGNIGGAARAMKTMGLSRLVLVRPEVFPSEIAEARASGAVDILGQARVVGCLEEALAGCTLVMGTSARDRRIPWPLLDPHESAARVVAQAGTGADVALVFGREYAGLTNEELQCCHFHVHIPASPDYGSLNLAAAVQVLAYEVRMAWRAVSRQPAAEVNAEDRPVTADELEHYYRHLEQTLVDIGFLDPQRPGHLMARLRRLYSRTDLRRAEMNILRGILTETRRALQAPRG